MNTTSNTDSDRVSDRSGPRRYALIYVWLMGIVGGCGFMVLLFAMVFFQPTNWITIPSEIICVIASVGALIQQLRHAKRDDARQ